MGARERVSRRAYPQRSDSPPRNQCRHVPRGAVRDHPVRDPGRAKYRRVSRRVGRGRLGWHQIWHPGRIARRRATCRKASHIQVGRLGVEPGRGRTPSGVQVTRRRVPLRVARCRKRLSGAGCEGFAVSRRVAVGRLLTRVLASQLAPLKDPGRQQPPSALTLRPRTCCRVASRVVGYARGAADPKGAAARTASSVSARTGEAATPRPEAGGPALQWTLPGLPMRHEPPTASRALRRPPPGALSPSAGDGRRRSAHSGGAKEHYVPRASTELAESGAMPENDRFPHSPSPFALVLRPRALRRPQTR